MWIRKIMRSNELQKMEDFMSRSSLWVMDKDYKGSEVLEFGNSWLFSPIVWNILSDKYIRGLIETPFGFKKSIISDPSLFRPLNDKVNNCNCTPDRICWEMSNQQVFFTKDKEVIAKSILDFVELNKRYDRNSEGTYPLQAEHIAGRFKEIADEILKLDENESPYFIFKNTSVDDGVEYWFSKYDEQTDEYIETPLSAMDKHVTEFVFIENGTISGFKSNIEYFK
jgi:hypothetical protein